MKKDMIYGVFFQLHRENIYWPKTTLSSEAYLGSAPFPTDFLCVKTHFRRHHEFQIMLFEKEIDPLDSKVVYKDLIENISFLQSIHTTLSSPSLSTATPCNLEKNSSTLSNFQSFRNLEN